MQREIKFRGQNIKTKEWLYGSLIINRHTGICYLFSDDCKLLTLKQCYVVIPETVGQYTGLKDKNGKEIYEGDVVRIKGEPPFNFDYRAEVVFKNGVFGTTDRYGGIERFSPSSMNIVEVVGNIHENPELLEVSE